MTSWKTIPADLWDVAVVGGGPAGMTAAMAAARAGAAVVLLERGERPGKKLLMTGNGKCNLGNRDLKPSYYYSDNMAMAASVLERFGTEETMAFFASLGLLVRERRGGLYPASEQAAVVLDALRYGLAREGVTILPQAMVRGLSVADKPASGYLVELEDGRRIRARRVVLPCGGQAAPRTGSDGSGYELARSLGHRVISPVPALVQLHCGEKYCKALAGVRAEGVVRLYGVSRPGTGRGGEGPGRKSSGCPGGSSWLLEKKREERLLEETGEIQFTEHGISGIPVFQLSGGANQLLAQGWKLRAELDFFPGYEEDTYERLCRGRLEQADWGTVEMFFTGMLHKKIMQVCIREAGLSPEQEAAGADREKLRRVFALCRKLPFTVTGSHPFDSAQVCRGGVSMKEVDGQLQSRHSPGLYLAGELLHVDGRCGGYNLQWAWASGHIAGSAAGTVNGITQSV